MLLVLQAHVVLEAQQSVRRKEQELAEADAALTSLQQELEGAVVSLASGIQVAERTP